MFLGPKIWHGEPVTTCAVDAGGERERRDQAEESCTNMREPVHHPPLLRQHAKTRRREEGRPRKGRGSRSDTDQQ